VGAAFALWECFILFNDDFYQSWRDNFWKEKNDGHLSRESLIYNRYIEGGCETVIGIVTVYVALFFR
jgi:hypothetical protein